MPFVSSSWARAYIPADGKGNRQGQWDLNEPGSISFSEHWEQTDESHGKSSSLEQSVLHGTGRRVEGQVNNSTQHSSQLAGEALTGGEKI